MSRKYGRRLKMLENSGRFAELLDSFDIYFSLGAEGSNNILIILNFTNFYMGKCWTSR